LPTGRQFLNDRDIEIAEDSERNRARNRRRRHHQVMWIGSKLAETGALRDAEFVLLVDDDQAELAELNVFLDKRLRTDDQIDIARPQIGERLLAFALRQSAG